MFTFGFEVLWSRSCFLVTVFLLSKKSVLLNSGTACQLGAHHKSQGYGKNIYRVILLSFLQNHVNPAMDFTQTPPGMLALDNMLYFAKHHQDAYIRVRLLLFKIYASPCSCWLCPVYGSLWREGSEYPIPLTRTSSRKANHVTLKRV